MEAQHLELKRSLGEWKEIVETVAAFATAEGGRIRVGVDSSGAVVGVQLGKGTLEELANRIKTNTDPPQYPTLTTEGPEERAVVTVEVQASPFKPVWAFGRPFKRVGPTNQRLTRDETYWLREQTTGRTWDTLPCPRLRVEDLDRKPMVELLRRAGLSQRTASATVLENLELGSDQGLTYAAALLFARHPQRFVGTAHVRCGRFLGTTAVDFLDERDIEGSVLTQADEALAFVARNTRSAIRITGKTAAHERVPEYPTEAVREAIVNAIVHRDYTSASHVQIRIYDDRLEVWNPGGLPYNLSVEELYRAHASRPRNRLLAGAFYRARLIEQWGTGTLRILRECETAGLPRPEFIQDMGMFIVRFGSVESSAGAEQVLRLNDRQRRALAFVREHGFITRNQQQTREDVSARQALRDLQELVDRGLLLRRGESSAAHYELLKRGSQ